MLNLMMAFNRNDAKKYDQDAKEIISKEHMRDTLVFLWIIIIN
jgi:hypothetical protein